MCWLEYLKSVAPHVAAYTAIITAIIAPPWLAILWKYPGFWEGKRAHFSYVGFYIVFLISTVLYYFTLGFWKAYRITMPGFVEIFGWLLILAGFVFLKYCQWTILAAGGWTPPLQIFIFLKKLQRRITGKKFRIPSIESKPTKLITSGPYSWVRHPMYGIGAPLFLTGAFFASGYLLVIPAPIIFYLLMYRIADIEEKQLVKIFGKKYIEYRKKVPKMFPRFKK